MINTIVAAQQQELEHVTKWRHGIEKISHVRREVRREHEEPVGKYQLH